MYDIAKKGREALKSKARRMAAGDDSKVDSSTWTPPALLRTEVKTGARPITKPSSKGVGESNAARDTKSAIGNPKRGAFKSGGAVKDAGVKDKKALGAVDPSPKRAKTQHYAGGGRDPSYVGAGAVTRDDKPVTSPKGIVDARTREPDVSDLYSSEQAKRLERGYKSGGKNWISGAIKKPGALRKSLGVKEGQTIPAKKLDAAAEKGGKLGQRARLAQTLGRMGKKTGGGVNLTVVVSDKDKQVAPGGGAPMPPMPRMGPPMAPPPPMPSAPPNPAMMAAAGAPPAGLGPMPRKTGGRISKVASSYKDMTAGAASGEGRLQKTDIASKHKNAPARKSGGKVYKSYKDMDAGAGSGEGRLEKTEIESRKMARRA